MLIQSMRKGVKMKRKEGVKEIPVHAGLQQGCPKCHSVSIRKHLSGYYSCKECKYEWTTKPTDPDELIAKRAKLVADRKERERVSHRTTIVEPNSY